MSAARIVASHPPKGTAVTLVGDAAVLAQLHPAACWAAWPLEGDHGQALPLDPIQLGFMARFDHAALLSVSLSGTQLTKDSCEFFGELA